MRSLSLLYCLLFTLLSLSNPVTSSAQAVPPSPRPTSPAVLLENPARPAPPKRELRAFWIATVANIDWPTQRGESPEVYRALVSTPCLCKFGPSRMPFISLI
jgi:hypothetical protein